MIVDRETFTELAVHLKMASDAILSIAQSMGRLSSVPNDNPQVDEEWARAINFLKAMNLEISIMESLLRALYEANKDDAGTGSLS